MVTDKVTIVKADTYFYIGCTCHITIYNFFLCFQNLLFQYPGSTPNKLQAIHLKSLNNSDCASAHPDGTISESNICTLTKTGEGACHVSKIPKQ